MQQTIGDLAVLVRSKNAGPFWLTLDIMFDKPETYHRVRDANVLTKKDIARMFKLKEEDIIVVNHDAALAIKISFPRKHSSGSAYDNDAFGGQQYAPILGLKV
ncbi:MAG: DUF4387 domain-containing protein [Bacteroidota bacterium]|jgi:hypothetical protein